MYRRYVFYLGLMVFSAVVIAVQLISPHENMSQGTTRSQPRQRDGYNLLFSLSRQNYGPLNRYAIKYQTTDEETAKKFAKKFQMPMAFFTNDESFVFENNDAMLTICRHSGHLNFEAVAQVLISADANKIAPLNHEELTTRAVEIFKDFELTLEYVELRVEAHPENENSHFTIIFINRLGNLKNFAFNNSVTLDCCGNFISLDYFFIDYDLLGTGSVKSMREAFDALPSRHGLTAVNLTDAMLVYAYINSIIQPAYLFIGETTDGSPVEYMVRAANY